MKKYILFLALSLISYYGFSQKAVASHDEIEKFLNTTTCIVYDSDVFNTYNSAIQTAVEQSWTITPYKFITMDEFYSLRMNPDYSFLIRTKVFPDNTNKNSEYTFLTLVVGEKDKNFEELSEICSFPLSYYNVDYDKYDYKMGALLLFVQNHIQITYDDPSLNTNNIITYYNRNTTEIGTKIIYLNADNLNTDVNTVSKISNFYGGTVKISTPDEIQQLIDEKDENAIILHIVAPPEGSSYDGKCYKMLVGAADGKLYYFDSQIITNAKPGKFLKQDFKNL
ncbi:MAG: hypothetical protein JXR68_04825 [Bacteroidales bacterium]|nr:hypothetical protein [Bacteroidales bacterium]